MTDNRKTKQDRNIEKKFLYCVKVLHSKVINVCKNYTDEILTNSTI